MAAGEFSWEGSKRVELANGIEWMISKHLKHMECYFDNVSPGEGRYGRVAVNEQTWHTLSFENARAEVEAMAKNGVTGMTFLVTDSGPFGRAAAAEAASQGFDKPIMKDPLTQLEEQAHGLIAQAAGINGATPVQMEIFTVRYAAMNADFAVLEERMARIKSMIDLAGLAVAEAV
jgi:hypothetical protein